MQSLIKALNHYTKLYNEGHPAISDKEWDDMYFKLQKKEQETGIIYANSPTQKIFNVTLDKLNTVTHSHPMLSLNKTKEISDVEKWAGSNEIIAMPKMDGLTCSLRYENGLLVGAETRGDGLVGEDVLHNASAIQNVPLEIPFKDTLVIDGEVICDKKTFQEEFANDYEHIRNFASGSIRLLNSEKSRARKLSFIVWDVITGFNNIATLSERLNHLSNLGFSTVNYTTSKDTPSIEDMIELIKATDKIYPIDGVVFKYNDCNMYALCGTTTHHPRGAIAFKFYDDSYSTKLIDIDFSLSKTGILTPVAIFDPIEIDSTIIERANLHNISVMYNTLGKYPFKGQNISVYKANMIIPQISDAERVNFEDIPNKEDIIIKNLNDIVCPVCNHTASLTVSSSGIENLICTNPLCRGKLVNQIDHFCSKKGLDIKYLSKATIEKLIEWGWISDITDLFSLNQYKSEWIKKDGFGIASVDKILQAIDKSRTCSLDKFITALGIPLIGSSVAKDICKYVASWEEFYSLITSKFNFSKWDGFGIEKSNSLLNFDYSNALYLINSKYIIVQEQEEIEEDNTINIQKLANTTFCITGKLSLYKNRAELVDIITKYGGRVVDSVTKKVDWLINNDINSTSTKNKNAEKLGIPIITEKEFQNML